MPRTTSVFGPAGVTRAWVDANGNFVPDCDLSNPAAQDLRASGGDACGVLSDVNFGKNVLTSDYAPRLLDGWNVRPSDWNLSLSLAQRIGRRSAIEIAYTRRTFSGFAVVDNHAVEATDWTPFSVVAPNDPRLPGGGGYVVSGLYDVVPEKAGRVDNLVAPASEYGTWSQAYQGVDGTLTLRFAPDMVVSAGVAVGQTAADNCHVRDVLPELSTSVTGTSAFGAGLNGSAVTPISPYCRVDYGVLTQLRGFATYTIPAIDVQVSAVFQSKPGAQLAANYAVPSAAVRASLGRDLSGGVANVTVNLVTPGTLYGDRINQVDVRIGKSLRLSGTRLRIGVDVYNVLNANAVLSYDPTFIPGGPWPQPLGILTPRFLKVGADLDF